MQILVTIPDELAAQVLKRGLTPADYVEQLLAETSRQAAPQEADTTARLADLEVFFSEMTAHARKVPVLPEEALTRESFYQDHD